MTHALQHQATPTRRHEQHLTLPLLPPSDNPVLAPCGSGVVIRLHQDDVVSEVLRVRKKNCSRLQTYLKKTLYAWSDLCSEFQEATVIESDGFHDRRLEYASVS